MFIEIVKERRLPVPELNLTSNEVSDSHFVLSVDEITIDELGVRSSNANSFPNMFMISEPVELRWSLETADIMGASYVNMRDVWPTSISTLVLIVIVASLPAGTLELNEESDVQRLGLHVEWVNFNFGLESAAPKLDPITVTIPLPFLGEFAGLANLALGTMYEKLRVNEFTINELLTKTKRDNDVPLIILEIVEESLIQVDIELEERPCFIRPEMRKPWPNKFDKTEPVVGM
jgi:hypothetical protein